MSHRFIAHDENGDLKVHTPFNADFIADLKNLVDKDSRRWVPAGSAHNRRGYWWVDGAYESQIEELLRDYFGAKTAKARGSRVREKEQPTEVVNVGEEDVVLALASARDPVQTIRDLTSRLGALTYELEMERAEGTRLRVENARINREIHRHDREINELKYKLMLAEARGGSANEMPHRGGRPLRNQSSPYAVLHLADDAPPEVVAAAYKTLIFKHHPDRGGDPEIAKRLNNARDEILGE